MLRSLFDRFGKRTGAPAGAARRNPLQLVGGRTTLAVGTTKRRELENELGPGVAYPAPGWHTWTVGRRTGDLWLLSAFFRADTLIAVEYYVAKTSNAPKYAPRTPALFLLQPDDVGIGNAIGSLPGHYQAVGGRPGGVGSVVYQQAYDTRWATGVALISANDGRIERIALYGNGT